MDFQIERRATRNLITFFISKMLTSLGFTVFSFGISLYILSITGSALSFATNIVFNVVPRALAAPFAGYVADRFPKKRIVIASMTGITLSVVLLIIYTWLFGLSVMAIYTITAIFSTIGAFNGVAFSSAIPNMVGKKRLQKALSFNQISYSIGGIGGPVIGGMLYGFVSMQVFLISMAVAYFIALILEATMDFTLFEQHQKREKESMLQSMKEGVKYLKEKPLVKSLLWMNIWLNFFNSAISVGIVFILVEQLKMPSTNVGIIQGAGAVGMLIASIYLSVCSDLRRPLIFIRRAVILACMFIGSIAIPLFFDFSKELTFVFYMMVLFSISAMNICSNTPIGVLIQRSVEDHYRGRVFGLIEMVSVGMGPIGSLIFGALFDFIDAQFLFVGIAFILFLLMMHYANRALRIYEKNPT